MNIKIISTIGIFIILIILALTYMIVCIKTSSFVDAPDEFVAVAEKLFFAAGGGAAGFLGGKIKKDTPNA